ncbi:MAG TPA: DUF3857 domain-containing protein [bacterium]|nr:DUF3857 domain-containing protein [bacterium]
MVGSITYKRWLVTCAVTVAVLCAVGEVHAQNGWGLPWGHMIPTEVDRDALAFDPSAGASVVFDRGLITVGPGFRFTFERHRRVQIFRTDAYRFANVEIPYHSSEQLEFVEAHTLTKDGQKVPVTPSAMHEARTGEWRKMVFAFPDVQPGCVVEYRYKVRSHNFYYLRPWVFQSEIPTERSELSVKLPENFEYAAVVNNSDFVTGPDTVEIASVSHEAGKIRLFTWRAQSLPPLTPEPYMASILNHRVLLDFQIVRYRDGNNVREFVDSWEDVADQVRKVYSPLLRTDESWPLWGTISGDLRPADLKRHKRELARRLYGFVRDSIALSGVAVSVYDSDLKPARVVLQQRRGNPLEKNLLFVALLRHHGIDAWPVLISRRSHYRFDRRDHRLEQFDHAIVAVDLGDEEIYCETGAPNAWMGYLPPDDQVDAGVVIGREDIRDVVIDLPAPPVDRDVMSDGSAEILPDGTARGNLTLWLGGQAAYELLCALADQDTAGYLHENWMPGLRTERVAVERDSENDWAPIKMSVDFVWPGAADVDGDRILLRPALIHALESNPFLTSHRRYPISFDTPWSEDCRMVWRIPTGFRLGDLPMGREVLGDGYEFRSSVVAQDNAIIATRFWRVAQRDFGVPRFEEMRELFNTVKLAQHGPLMLYRD